MKSTAHTLSETHGKTATTQNTKITYFIDEMHLSRNCVRPKDFASRRPGSFKIKTTTKNKYKKQYLDGTKTHTNYYK